MLYTNEDIFNIKYNERLDRIEIKQKGWTRIKQSVQNHKFLSTVIALFIMFSLLNIVLIYNFLEVLKNI